MLSAISKVIVWACITVICVTPVVYLYFIVNVDSLAHFTKASLSLPIQWDTVSLAQWYALLSVTFIYHGIGLVSLYVLSKAFKNFAKGELFNHSNSQNLRWFALLIFIQAITRPIHYAFSSVILSFNHPTGEKVLAFLVSSEELKIIVLAGIMWVISELVVKARVFETENKQFA
ncbi:DUF2975 domain-containing protein [Alteromonas sp. ASW11-130]|uniref:DUF2975 domain-containing protein n=1 Tax=Alteromonas sp. ASW11-130 TaxID=3015775 RepID=UPI00224207E9|nr:DUF2975 domain-containing protein [Alteromonas sp. ASW11-130]MCW8091093.1 DUF2975 domain-containing protein [Alteromonas sp. ASW11-130]